MRLFLTIYMLQYYDQWLQLKGKESLVKHVSDNPCNLMQITVWAGDESGLSLICAMDFCLLYIYIYIYIYFFFFFFFFFYLFIHLFIFHAIPSKQGLTFLENCSQFAGDVLISMYSVDILVLNWMWKDIAVTLCMLEVNFTDDANMNVFMCIRAVYSAFAGHSLWSQGSNASSGGQWRFWSDCADAQADLSLRWVQPQNLQ